MRTLQGQVGRALALAAAALVLVSSSLRAQPVTVATEFREVCRALRDGDSPFFGRGGLENLRVEATAAADPSARTLALAAYGQRLMAFGEPAAAIEVLEEVRRSASDSGDRGLLAATVWQLALAHLQAAEDRNCVLHGTGSSCILPFDADAVHEDPQAALEAARLLTDYLALNPQEARAAWLLNVAVMAAGQSPATIPERFRLDERAFTSGVPMRRWTNRAPDLGVASVDLAGGAAMEDFDGDGLLDLVSSTWDPCGSMKAFRNDGRGGFEDVSAAWGLDEQLGGLNLVTADYDGDGAVDILLLRGAWLVDDGRTRNSLLRNEVAANGRFRDVTAEAGIAEPALPTQAAAWADVDGDGDLDLFVGNEASERGVPDPSQLFLNLGPDAAGVVRFTDVAAEAGVLNDRYAKAAVWGDYDDDGDPDLFVSNFGPNRLYRNEGRDESGRLRFVDVAPELGVTGPERESFTSWFFDYDNDGRLDLLVADYRRQAYQVAASAFGVEYDDGQPRLYRNLGGRFEEVSLSVGLRRPLMPMGANYGDLDNDGFADIYFGTGEPDLASVMPNVMYRNRGGTFFDEVTYSGGFGHLQKGHGVAFGDLDNDGDQDLFEQMGGFYPGDAFANALFENPGGGGRWVTLLLEGRGSNRFAVGARIEVIVGGPEGRRSIHALVGSGGSFGASSLRQEIGLGAAESIDDVVVRWPFGEVQRLGPLALDGFYRVVEGESPAAVELPRVRLGGRR